MSTAPFGSWASPITSELLVADVVSLTVPTSDLGHIYWCEGRPKDGGRVQLVKDGQDLLPAGFGARTGVHEYGGRCYAVRNGVVVFSNWADQRLYRLEERGEPIPLTAAPPTPRAWRYADPSFTPDGTTSQ